MSSLFITGSTGFIGNRLIRQIDCAKYDRIYCLSRSAQMKPPGLPDCFEFIRGDLCESGSYEDRLAVCESVLHLAAVTGKAPREQYFLVNSKGTQILIKRCEERGVKNFLYLSTIAVKYPAQPGYYYAQSKILAEEAVRRSRLNHAILRPSIVLGKEGAIWKRFSDLARRPILLIPGSGKVRIQPICVEDLVNCVLTVLAENLFSGEIFEVGGREELSFEHFLKEIHRFYRQKDPIVFHLPLKPLVAVLSTFEKYFDSTLPITAGQLSAFQYDSTVEPNKLLRKCSPGMRSLSEMLERLISR